MIAGAGTPRRQCSRSIYRQLGRIAREQEIDVEPPALQMTRDDECIAAVVAGAGKHQHTAAGRKRAGEFCCLQACAFHQTGRRQPLGGLRFQRADFRRPVYRCAAGRRIHGASLLRWLAAPRCECSTFRLKFGFTDIALSS